MNSGKLYLVPNYIGDTPASQHFPIYNSEIVQQLKYFFVENPKPARALIKSLNPNVNFDELELIQFDKHAKDNTEIYQEVLTILKNGNNVGVLSDAGCPGIADPGSELVAWAHSLEIEVIPLIGPSSIFLTLMASGLNGQHFSFIGYLPKDSKEKVDMIKKIGTQSKNTGTSFLFIETPYKAESTFMELVQNLGPYHKICLGMDIFSNTQEIQTKTVEEWKKLKTAPRLKDRLVVFAIG